MKQVKANSRRNKKNVNTKEFREALRSKVNWDNVIKALVKSAIGGESIRGVNGIYEPRPNLKAMQLLLEYAFGRPNVIELSEDDKAEAISQFQSLLAGKNIVNVTDCVKNNSDSGAGNTGAEDVTN